MPSYRWSCLIAALCGVGGASWGTAALAYQYPPLSDDINTRFIHRPDAWVGGGFQSSGPINQSPAEFGPAPGMQQRSPNGSPASGDSFPFMSPGPLPGGLSPDGFNGSGMRPPVNQPASITNNPLFGGNGQSPFGQNPAGQNASGQTPFGSPTQMTGATRMKPKVSWALETAQQPYVGLLGQIARPGVYEIERRGTVVLADLLEDIGGLAKDASGQFRIIRNGRPGQTTSYSGAAQFELMAGDLIIADAQPSQIGQRATNVKTTSDDAVQIGFVNLVDRPVVLKLRNERATVFEILTTMGQDQSLASQIKIVTPASQRFQGQPRPDSKLVSETVLIFPQNSVKKSAALESLPEPFKLKRDADTSAQPRDAAQPYAPRANLSPDVTQSPRSKPSVGAWSDSAPLPQSAQPVSQPSIEPSPEIAEVPPPPAEEFTASKRPIGVRGAPRRTATAPDRIARDSNMLHAPPVEGSTPSPHDVPPADVAQDNAPIPELNDSTPFEDNDSRTAEPSLLNAKGKKRPIHLAKDEDSNDTKLTAADLDEAEASADKAGSSWSIWPPILTAGVGLLALIGFSLSLRRRTQSTAQTSQVATTQPMPTTIRNPQSVPRRELLDEIIDDQLPLTEERVPFVSPMQFHGRPQPPKTIRMDQKHSLPRPHSPNAVGARGQRSEVRNHAQEIAQPATTTASRSATTATQKIRIDRTGTTGTGTKIISSTTAKTASHQPISGTLDRALSAVQKREEHGA